MDGGDVNVKATAPRRLGAPDPLVGRGRPRSLLAKDAGRVRPRAVRLDNRGRGWTMPSVRWPLERRV